MLFITIFVEKNEPNILSLYVAFKNTYQKWLKR